MTTEIFLLLIGETLSLDARTDRPNRIIMAKAFEVLSLRPLEKNEFQKAVEENPFRLLYLVTYQSITGT